MRKTEPFEAYRPINGREHALRLLAPPLAHVLIHTTSRLQGKRVHGLAYVRRALAQHGNAIFAFWHNRSFMGSFWWRWLLPKAPVCAMISRSLDGEILARVLRYIGASAVRGSEYDGGTAALKAAACVLRDGVNLCITPDGPRGPLYAMKPGLAALASLSGKPVIPFAYDCTRTWRLNSWDSFIVPLPGGHAEFVFGEPIVVDRSRKMEAWSAVIQSRLMDVTNRAEALTRAWDRGLPHCTRRAVLPNPHRGERPGS
ncbi:MAG: lysophospholipid acyltransferase family protein [Verrucomicrobia bacterium]|nr:lysophospholipid acyltransferase family protein [Verrucomicrobiota bacterium]